MLTQTKDSKDSISTNAEDKLFEGNSVPLTLAPKGDSCCLLPLRLQQWMQPSQDSGTAHRATGCITETVLSLSHSWDKEETIYVDMAALLPQVAVPESFSSKNSDNSTSSSESPPHANLCASENSRVHCQSEKMPIGTQTMVTIWGMSHTKATSSALSTHLLIECQYFNQS